MHTHTRQSLRLFSSLPGGRQSLLVSDFNRLWRSVLRQLLLSLGADPNICEMGRGRRGIGATAARPLPFGRRCSVRMTAPFIFFSWRILEDPDLAPVPGTSLYSL
jgi:hypothetical protein